MIYEKNKISYVEIQRLKYFFNLVRGIYYFNVYYKNQEMINKSLTLPNDVIKKQTDNDIYSIIFCIDSILDIIKKIHLKVKNINANLNLQDITIGKHKMFEYAYGTKKSLKWTAQKFDQQNSNLIKYSNTFCMIPLTNEILFYSEDLIKRRAFPASAGDFLFFENESVFFGRSYNPSTLNLVYNTVNNPVSGTRLLKSKIRNTKNTNLSLYNIVHNQPIDISLHRIQDILHKIEE